MTDTQTNWINAVIGFALFGFGGAFLYLEMKVPPTHTTHIVLFAGIAFVGALSIRPDPILMVIKQLVVVATPFIPVFGERRSGAERRSGESAPPKDEP